MRLLATVGLVQQDGARGAERCEEKQHVQHGACGCQKFDTQGVVRKTWATDVAESGRFIESAGV